MRIPHIHVQLSRNLVCFFFSLDYLINDPIAHNKWCNRIIAMASNLLLICLLDKRKRFVVYHRNKTVNTMSIHILRSHFLRIAVKDTAIYCRWIESHADCEINRNWNVSVCLLEYNASFGKSRIHITFVCSHINRELAWFGWNRYSNSFHSVARYVHI